MEKLNHDLLYNGLINDDCSIFVKKFYPALFDYLVEENKGRDLHVMENYFDECPRTGKITNRHTCYGDIDIDMRWEFDEDYEKQFENDLKDWVEKRMSNVWELLRYDTYSNLRDDLKYFGYIKQDLFTYYVNLIHLNNYIINGEDHLLYFNLSDFI